MFFLDFWNDYDTVKKGDPMIYSCHCCGTKLVLQPEHLQTEIRCPECEKSFTAEKIPPVEVYRQEPQPVSFFRIFQIVIYAFISISLILLFCLALYISAKHFFPEYFKEHEKKQERLQEDRHNVLALEELRQQNIENSERIISRQRSAEDEADRSIRDKNKEAEEAFLKEYDRLQERKKE